MRVCIPQRTGARGIPKASTSGAVLRPRRGCGWLQCNHATRRRSEKLFPRRRKPPARLAPIMALASNQPTGLSDRPDADPRAPLSCTGAGFTSPWLATPACTASCADAAPDTRTQTILGATVDRADSRVCAVVPEGVAGQPRSHNYGGNRLAGVHFRPDRYQNSNKANSAPKRVFQWNTSCSSPSTAQISGYGAFFNPQTS